MLAEFIKKPVGMMVLLAGAAGGPYVLHETDAGKMVLNTANGWIKSDSTANSDLQNFGMGSLDPSALAIPLGHHRLFRWAIPPVPVSGSRRTGFSVSINNARGKSIDYAWSHFRNGCESSNGFLGCTNRSELSSYCSDGPSGFNQLLGASAPYSRRYPELWNYTTGVPTLPQLQQSSATQPITGGPVRDLRDVIRFDINPAWVMQNFGRVTTVLADVKLDGLRVPLVTGTAPTDLAGTITYYFDNQQTLRRINLQGLTGNLPISRI